jgi:hypothetical protein
VLLSLVFEHFIFFRSTPKKKEKNIRKQTTETIGEAVASLHNKKIRKCVVFSFKNRILFLFFGTLSPEGVADYGYGEKKTRSLTAHSTSYFEKEEDFFIFFNIFILRLNCLVPPL